MRYHDFVGLTLGLCVRLGASSAPQQTTAQPLTAPFTLPAPTAGLNPDNILKRQAASRDTCGYVDGEPVTCDTGTCGLLIVFGRDNAYLGCCSAGGCAVPTTCIEEGSAADGLTLECTESQSPACATFTWPAYSAQSYACAESSTTGTVTNSTITATADPSAAPTELVQDAGLEPNLNTTQRIGAGVGSGVFGLLLLGFFAVFGCWMAPRPRASRPRPYSPKMAGEAVTEQTQFLQHSPYPQHPDYPQQPQYAQYTQDPQSPEYPQQPLDTQPIPQSYY